MTLYQPVNFAIAALKVATRPYYMIAALVSIDGICLSLAGAISVSLRLYFNGEFHPSTYWQLWPVVGLFLLAYALAGLYPGQAISPVEELRRVVLTTTLLYLSLGSAIFLFRDLELYSRAAFLMAWGLSLILVLLGRYGLRALCARQPWWGYPVLVMGAGQTGEMVIRTLTRRPELGLKPVAVLDDDPKKHGSLADVPVVGNLSMAPSLRQALNIPYAIVAMPGVPSRRLIKLLERYGRDFPHLLIIPDLFGMASLWVGARDLGGMLGLEARQQLLLPWPKRVKRLLDKSLAILTGVGLLPIIALIALLIRLDSRGPIFYGQTRIGRNGRPFKAWKFRSMVPNADKVLQHYLSEHPELMALWERDHKLKYDPRITPIGNFLRRTSLDELPQLWNVLRGEMSLVGPRPIVNEEAWRYGDRFDLYLQVLPGVTGLWQVSGRNNITYEERVNLDAYYVRNWSVWLDVYILIRTVWVVLIGDGAY
ncbi:MAG: undecaprenyl-phosphate galactose phosphotransferase WbaP [Leptolyngbya sp. SIO4C1]|nr:undecaprenyl-phosphate galactose phosphotransferase WbaP [Leptolyngbya sp. SIO4C1]